MKRGVPLVIGPLSQPATSKDSLKEALAEPEKQRQEIKYVSIGTKSF